MNEYYKYINELKKKEISFKIQSTVSWYIVSYFIQKTNHCILIKQAFPRFKLGSLAKLK